MTYTRRTKDELAARVARDIPEGATVNLGIGQPTLVANHMPSHLEICCTARTAFWAWALRLQLAKKITT